jgi:hypothetical protein
MRIWHDDESYGTCWHIEYDSGRIPFVPTGATAPITNDEPDSVEIPQPQPTVATPQPTPQDNSTGPAPNTGGGSVTPGTLLQCLLVYGFFSRRRSGLRL